MNVSIQFHFFHTSVLLKFMFIMINGCMHLWYLDFNDISLIINEQHKTKRHHSVKTERRHSATFQSPFSRLNGRYISVTIQWPFVAIQSPFRHLSVIFTFLFSVYNWSYMHYFFIYFKFKIPRDNVWM